MIRTLITILCAVHQEYEKDMSLGPPETRSTEQPGGVCGGEGDHGQAEGLEPRAGNTMDKAVEPGMPGLDKLRKKKIQWPSTRLKIKIVSEAGDRAGLSAGSWGVFAMMDLCWQQHFPVHIKDDLAPARAHCSCICVL